MINFKENDIVSLREKVKERLSEKRYIHTLGVEDMAVKLGVKCLPDRIGELRVAALLHDISKEYSEAEHFELINQHNICLTESDVSTPAIWHSITAPIVIERDFSEYATPSVLSAVRNHTVGDPDMSVFDEIIFLADYIEEGRRYISCKEVREEFFRLASSTDNTMENIYALHKATLSSLDNTIKFFVSKNEPFHERTESTRVAILAKSERQKYGN